MTRTPTFSPRPHEAGQHPGPSGATRVDDEYVFTTVTESGPRDGLTKFSVRVDPSDGSPDELVLHVTRRIDREASGAPSQRDAATVTVSTPTLRSPPRVDALESVLETWCRRHWGDDFDTSGVGRRGERGDRPARANARADSVRHR
ncbi:hypothetical protein C2R22_10630 [Salinigranum rubrum]|uniref:Uncharacterized protein n=1 Tax=Salinigranum rubrum TaxID=755307 RepID=A0A2I8VJF4_9EURY|nr:hypothetical protein [Salinigranum rubrum]AUV82051.1 hypothetical protein C2R22_10630 [Salinigranum rubrum]